MLFRDEPQATHILKNISYYRLKGYWWDMQIDYKQHTLKHQLPEKAAIAKEMELNLHNELSSWLEAITYIRNIVAHHSRLWSRNMVKRPTDYLNNPIGKWFKNPLKEVQAKKPFLIISCMVYLCNEITPRHQIRTKILELFNSNTAIPIYKLGFLNNWKKEPIWQ